MSVTQQIGWYWNRLLAMDAAEIGERLCAKARKMVSCPVAQEVARFRLGPCVGVLPLTAHKELCPPELRTQIAADAALIAEGKFALFGWHEAHVGSPPLWHRDFIRGLDGPAAGDSAGINHRELPTGADFRAIWEVNRWSEVVRLMQHAWLESDVESARLAQRWIADWVEKNPVGQGINWTSALEAALRLMNFVWIDALVRALGDAGLTEKQDELAQSVVPAHAMWVWRNRSVGSSANNHLIGELAGVLMASRRWPSLAKICCCAERAWDLMKAETLRQFAPDGGNREQALHYHLFAWEMIWQSARMMGDVSGEIWRRLRRSAEFFCAMTAGSDGWDFGDSDDALITPLTLRRETMATEWRAWLTGQAMGGALQFWLGEAPTDETRVSQDWQVFSDSGMAVARRGSWQARLDGSPLGLGGIAAHGHLDAMHLSLWVGDCALVVDPGTGAYYADAALRARLADWEYHNGPVPLAGRSVPKRTGPFLWTEHHDVPLLTVHGDACEVRFACQAGFVKRSVSMLPDGGGWRVVDETPTKVSHVVRWRLAPEWEVESHLDRQFVFRRAKSGLRVQLMISASSIENLSVSPGDLSPRFGQVVQGLVVACAFRHQISAEWTLLSDGKGIER
ncbi:MAG: alginate lyase family protein [Verrucomicrobiales bacterium]|nr:alginate lyase family protein [Verrucomicrobiales bacterium]MCP5560045.1 alginate lyase family protein [Verrucomicrobiaceae bacterium]